MSALVRPVAAAAAGAHSPPEPVHFLVSGRIYILLWLCAIIIDASIALYLSVHVLFYSIVYARPSFGYYLSTFRLIPIEGVPITIKVYQAMVLLYVVSLLRMLYRHPFQRPRAIPSTENDRPTLSRQNTMVQWAFRLARSTYATTRCVVSIPSRYWGVHSAFFEVATLLREAAEITLQSIQAYSCSLGTTNALLNITFGLLIPLNCISSPLISWVLRHDNVARQRVTILMVDLVLDLVWLVQPMMLMTTYFQAFVGTESVMYRDTFLARTLTETHVMIVSSYGDLPMKIAPAISVWLTIDKIARIVRARTLLRSPTHSMHVATNSIALVKFPQESQQSIGSFRRGRIHWLVKSALEWVLALWGCVVAVVYLVVLLTPVQCESGCKLILRPWFTARKCYCAVQEINCYSRGMTGSELEMRGALSRLNTKSLTSLIITHCSRLEVPAELNQFTNLFNLEIYNSSIVSWSEKAHIDKQVFKELSLVYLILSGVSTVPAALLGSQLPTTLLEIAIIGSNLTALPSSVVTDWQHVRTLYLDHGHFEMFPRELGQLRLNTLALNYNRMHSIPNDVLVTSDLMFLSLNANPLIQLPSQIGLMPKLYDLQMQMSNISTVEKKAAWLTNEAASQRIQLFAYGSMLCADDLHEAPSFVICTPRVTRYRGVHSYSYYTLEGKMAERDLVEPLPPDRDPVTWT